MKARESDLDAERMTEEIWEKFVGEVHLFPGKRMEIKWKFEDENI